MLDIISDLRVGARNLVRRPGLALGATLTIALGIGATTTVYSVVDGVILRPLPYEGAGRLVAIGATTGSGEPDPETGLQELGQMMSDVYLRYGERARSFERVAALAPYRQLVSDQDDVEEQVAGARIGPELLDMLGVTPVLGRTFLPEEFSLEGRVALITYEYWQRRYGRDPGVLGQPLESVPTPEGRSTIVGILPEGFVPPETFFPAGESPQIYAPLPMADPGPGRFVRFTVRALGRLAPGATLEQAREEAARIADEVRLELAGLPVPPLGPSGIGLNDLHAQTVGTTGRALWVFLGAAGLLLLLARALDRRQELGVRLALGAARARLVRLLFGEAAVLSLVGGASGVALAYGGVATFLAYAPASIPRLSTVAVDGRVLAVAALTTLAVGLAAGLIPALRLTGRAPWERLQSGGRTASEPGSRLRAVMVGGQIALAVVLLSGAGLLFNSFLRLRARDPGFEPEGLIAIASPPRGPVRIGPGQVGVMWQQWDPVLEALSAVPGVDMAAAVNTLPLQAPTWAPEISLAGDAPQTLREGIAGYVVTPGIFETMGIDVLQGRALELTDRSDAERVVVVNEEFVRTELQGGPALDVLVTREVSALPPLMRGAGFVPDSESVAMRIVGVVEDVVQAGTEDGPGPAIYVPYAQADFAQLGNFQTVVRTALPLEAVGADLRRALTEAGRLPQNIDTMWERMSEIRATPRFQALLIGAFALVAILLAAAGLHGSLAHTVRRRQRELGVRIALGADRATVLRMVLRQGIRVALAGLALGLLGVLALTRVFASFLYGVEPYDPVTLLGVALVLLLVCAAACLAPARKATAVDPVRVLQAE
jgi:putative ABC transport system permease protein